MKYVHTIAVYMQHIIIYVCSVYVHTYVRVCVYTHTNRALDSHTNIV